MQHADDELTIQSEELAFLERTLAEAASGVIKAPHTLYEAITEPPEHRNTNDQQPERTRQMSTTADQPESGYEPKSVAQAIFRTELPEMTESNNHTWVKALKRLCIVQKVEWVLEHAAQPTISNVEADRVIAALQCVVAKLIKDEDAMGLPRNIRDRTIPEIIDIVEAEYSKKSHTRHTTLRTAVHKIELHRGDR